jgi:hypothetical protein
MQVGLGYFLDELFGDLWHGVWTLTLSLHYERKKKPVC